jgi:hypothetical protein
LVISLRRWRRVGFWIKFLLVVVVLALILPPAIRWARQLMFSAATQPPEDEEVLTPGGKPYGQSESTLFSRLVEVLRSYYRGP